MKPIRASSVSFGVDRAEGFVSIRLHDGNGNVITSALCTLEQAATVNETLTQAIRSAAGLAPEALH